MKKNQETTSLTTKILIIGAVLFVLFLFSSCSALILMTASDTVTSGNIAIIPVQGIITTTGSGSGQVSADELIPLLEQAGNNPKVKGVILEMNTPGGSPVASDEIGQAVKELREKNITVVGWMREVSASGGYWIAANTEHIVANRMTITGSIGVIGSFFGFEDLLEEYNVSYRRFVSGSKKDIGTPFRAMSFEEQQFLQAKMDRIHDFFIEEVALNRNMSFAEAKLLATGEFYLGVEAAEVGLVDELGGLDEAIAFIEHKQGITAQTFKLQVQRSFLDELLNVQVQVETPVVQTGLRT